MPQLLIFLPCQKVIVGKEDNNVSLISVIQDVAVGLPEGVPELPEKALVPMPWYAFAHWESEPGDAGIEFEQQFVLFTETGENVAESPIQEVSFTVSGHRVYTRFEMFPIGRSGSYSLHVRLRIKGKEEWKEVSEFPIRVSYTTEPLPKYIDGTPVTS